MRWFVVDTNVLVSAVLFPGSTPHRALLKARAQGELVASEETLAEFRRVLLLEKFDKHIDRVLREAILAEYVSVCTVIARPEPIRICRDPRDDKFLEAAVSGHAEAILTGDRDLLALNPFRGIQIVTPAQFLEI